MVRRGAAEVRGRVAGGVACLVAVAALFVSGAWQSNGPGGAPGPAVRSDDAEGEFVPNRHEIQTAVEVAREWATAFLKCEDGLVMALSDVPFAVDGVRIAVSRRQLEGGLRRMMERRGVYPIRDLETRFASARELILDPCMPLRQIVVLVHVEGLAMEVAVRMGDPFRVVGYRD